MPCRDLLCVIESADGDLTPAFRQALAVARHEHAYLTVVSLARHAVAPGSTFGAANVGAALHELNERARRAASAAARTAEDAARMAGLRHEVVIREASLTEAASWIGRRARVADLTLLDRPGPVLEAREAFFEAALFETGRPVIVATPDHVSERVGHLALAWDGSRVAARALADALSMFPEVSQVDVIIVSGDKDLSRRTPGVQVAEHLARREIHANVIEVSKIGDNVARTIDHAARSAGADLIVAGGFGHSRLREFVLGGVTRELSQSACLPVLLAH